MEKSAGIGKISSGFQIAKSAVNSAREGTSSAEQSSSANVTSCYALWEILQGNTVIQDPEYIAMELRENREKLIHGISYYKKPSLESKVKLENQTKVKPLRRDFVSKLSKFLDLDEWQSLELFHSYLQYAFRGSCEHLQNVFKNEIHTESLLIKVMEYYFEERVSILRCLETILGNWHVASRHPFQKPFSEFISEVLENNLIITEVWKQYRDYSIALVIKGRESELDMSKRYSHRFAQQFLQEQIFVLRLVFFLFKDFQQSSENLLEAVKLFQAQNFGLRQVNRQAFDGFTELLVTQIGYLQVMVLVQAMDLDGLVQCAAETSVVKHPVMKKKSIIKELDAIFSKWGDLLHHGPVLLSWTIVKYLIMDDNLDGTTDVRKMGHKAMQCNVFSYLLNLMRSCPFNNDDVFSDYVKAVVYSLISVVLTLFHETTLGDPQMIIAVLQETLKSEELCQRFWQSDSDSGMAMLLKSTKNRFPFRFSPFVQLMGALSKDKETSENVFSYVNNMNSYTEPSNVNSLSDVDCTDADETIWKLINAKILYKTVVSTADKIVIPNGTLGKVYTSNEGVHLLRWSFRYSCWQLFLLEMDSFLQYNQHNSDGNVEEIISKVIDIVDLLDNILKYNWEKIESLVMLVDRVYYILQRYSSNPRCPPQLITTCLKCLITVTSQEPIQSWSSFQQTGFLPFCISSIQPSQKRVLISSVAVDPGNFGRFLATTERASGNYVVTIATLDLMKELVAILYPAAEKPSQAHSQVAGIDDFLACVVFVCRDIFSGYRKWQYQDYKQKYEIGLKCLEIFHKILTIKDYDINRKYLNQTFDVSLSEHEVQELETSHVSRLCDMLVEGFLWSDFGQSLLLIVGIGVDVITVMQTSSVDSSSLVVVKALKSALTVLNEVLDRKPECSEKHGLTPLEQTLISHVSRKLGSESPEGVHLVSTIASYVFFKQDNELAAMAIELLKKIAMISPMSMYGSLGSNAESLRDTFTKKLASLTEDVRLKVAILNFLSCAVENQPGLMEVFLDLKYTSPAEKNQMEIGPNSCIKPVLSSVTAKTSNTPVFVPVVAASYKFLFSLWKNGREVAMITVKKSDKFWEHLSESILKDLPPETDEEYKDRLQMSSFAFSIIAQELHYIKSGSVDPSLTEILKQFADDEKYLYWSNKLSEVTILRSQDALNFLRSWRTFLVVLAQSEMAAVCLREHELKSRLLENIAQLIKNQLNDEITNCVLKMAMEMSSLFLMLLQKWIGFVHSPVVLVDSVANVLQTAHNTDCRLLERIRIPLFSALTLLLQNMRQESIIDDLEQASITVLLPLLCEPLQYNLDTEDTKLIERQNKVLSVSLCLLNEIVICIDQPLRWNQTFAEHSMFSNLIRILDRNLRKKENIDVVESAMHFVLSLSKYKEPAQALSLNFVVQPLCLGMAALNQKSLHDSNKLPLCDDDSTSHLARWQNVWRLGLTVMSSLLKTLRYEFLKETLDFIGVHRERLAQAMDVVRINQTPSCLDEADNITAFLVEFSLYRKEWQLALPDVLQIMMFSVAVLLETSVSLLIHPRLLTYLIEKPVLHQSQDTSQPSTPVQTSARKISSTTELLRPYATPDDPLEKQNPKIVNAQKRLLKIVCNVLAILKNFTPNICEILLDEAVDTDEYTPFFAIDFKTPVLDNEASPSFGSLVSCLNMCLGHLHAAYPRPSASPEKSPWKFTALNSALPRSMVHYAMENAAILILSQAYLYLKNSRVETAKKDHLKRRLSSELEPFVSGIMNHFERRSYSPAPGSTPTSGSPSGAKSFGRSRSEPRESGDQKFFQLIDRLLKSLKCNVRETRR